MTKVTSVRRLFVKKSKKNKKNRNGMYLSASVGVKAYGSVDDDSSEPVKVNCTGADVESKIAKMMAAKCTHFELMNTGHQNSLFSKTEYLQDRLCDDGYLEDVDADEVKEYNATEWADYDGSVSLEFKVVYRLSPAEAATWRRMAASVKAPSKLSYLKKVEWIQNWICNRCQPIPQYGQTAGHTGYEAIVKRRSVCEGYAVLFKKICDANGIVSRYVTGTSGKALHGWNAVLYKGKWYFVDTYWDEEDSWGTENPVPMYLMTVPDDDHKLDASSAKKLAGHPFAKEGLIDKF